MYLFLIYLSIFYSVLSNSESVSVHPGLIHRLQRKLAPHGVKLSIPGLQGEADGPVPGPEPDQPGLVRLLSLLCSLELNGNLHSELEQTVEKERACLLQDSLLQGLLDSSTLRHCLDITMENSTPGKIKVLEVRLNTRCRPKCFVQMQIHSGLVHMKK